MTRGEGVSWAVGVKILWRRGRVGHRNHFQCKIKFHFVLLFASVQIVHGLSASRTCLFSLHHVVVSCSGPRAVDPLDVLWLSWMSQWHNDILIWQVTFV